MKKIFYILFTFHFAVGGSLFTLEAQPSITWQKTYGHTGWDDYANSIVQTPDNGYILTGSIDFNEMFIMRLNQFGDTVWMKVYPWEAGMKIERTNDNNYIVCGGTTRVYKIDINGNSIWTGGPYDAQASTVSIKQTPDGGYILCGSKVGPLSYDIPYLLKINSNGAFQWDTSYSNEIFWGWYSEIVLTSNNDYLLCGNFSDTVPISFNLFVQRTNSLGNQLWFRSYDTLTASSMVKDNLGNYIIAGGNTFLTKIDTGGTMQWFKFIHFFYPCQSSCNSITNTFDGGYALTGLWDSATNVRAYLVKTDSLGNGTWYKSYGLDDAVGIGIRQTSDSGYVFAGTTNITFTEGEIYVVKTDKTGFANPIGVKPMGNQVPLHFNLCQNYPNPFNPDTKIKFDIPVPFNKGGERGLSVQLKIYDILGREVATLVNDQLSPGTYEAIWNASNFSTGVYFYRLVADDYTETKKMILLK